MRLLAPIATLFVAAIVFPLTLTAQDETPESDQTRVITRTITIDDEPRARGIQLGHTASISLDLSGDDLPEALRERIREALKKYGGSKEFNLGEMFGGQGMMVISMDEDDEGDAHPHRHAQADRTQSHLRKLIESTIQKASAEGGQEIVIDLDQVTNGLIKGTAMISVEGMDLSEIDLGDIMSHIDFSGHEGGIEMDVEVIMADDGGKQRRVIRRFQSGDDGHRDHQRQDGQSQMRGGSGHDGGIWVIDGPQGGDDHMSGSSFAWMPGHAGQRGTMPDMSFGMIPGMPQGMAGFQAGQCPMCGGGQQGMFERNRGHDRDFQGDWDDPEARLHELETKLHEGHMDDESREEIIRIIEHIRGEGDEGGHDEFFDLAGEFVEKINVARKLTASLDDGESLAVFGVWMARQHLEPEARVNVLTPIMNDDTLQDSVRNAAAWVVMDALGEMHRDSDAQATLTQIILRNGAKPKE
jgi:hypothetical protein